MPAEAAFSFNARNRANEQITLRGDTWTEFRDNVYEMFGDPEAAEEFLDRFVATAKSANPPVSEQQAIQNIQNAFPGSTVGQAPPSNGEPQAGEIRIINGVPKKWIPAGISRKTNQPYKGFWGKAD